MKTLVIAGLGSRGRLAYGREIAGMKDRAKVVAVADTSDEVLELAGEEHGIPGSMRFHSAEELFSQPCLADAAIICTQDRQHVPHALMALEKGYDILLEKPISPRLEELQAIQEAASCYKRKVIICHVLRYTPFFRTIKSIIDSGSIGEIASIQALENVRYWHQAHSFVRGSWRQEGQTSPMILAKCCHDLDYLVWLTGRRCQRVSSFGSLMYFRKENAPQGAGQRCLGPCKAKADCPYDAEKIYLTNDCTGVLKGNTGWPCNVLSPSPTEASIREALATGPYGRCVFACDNDVVDHQVVNLQMEGGASLSLTMSAFTSSGGRTLKVMGTLGDIWADMDQCIIKATRFGEKTQVIDVRTLSDDLSGHGGGDLGLVTSFLQLLETGSAGADVTTLETSIESHLIALGAEASRLNNGMPVELSSLRSWSK